MKKRIHKLLFYTLLIGVYGAFFSVESFYNFEGQGSASHYLHAATLGTKATPVVQTSPLHSGSSRVLRLNKHYHQEDVSPCPSLLSPPPPEYVLAPQMLGSYRHTDLPEPALLYRPLRGPPAFVA